MNSANNESRPRLSSLKNAISSIKANHNFSVITENGCVILENRIDMCPNCNNPQDNGNGWADIKIKEVKKIIKSTDRLLTKQILKISSSFEELRHVGTYNILISASKPGYWLQSKVDISKFKIDDTPTNPQVDDIITQTRLDSFNRNMFGVNNLVKGNLLSTTKLASRIYWLSNGGTNNNGSTNSNFFLIDIILDQVEEKYTLESEGPAKKYLKTQEIIISRFRDFLITYSKLSDLYHNTYSKINLRSNKIRNNALHLQRQINNLLKTKENVNRPVGIRFRAGKNSVANAKQTADSDKMIHIEEALLQKASLYFSKLTGIDYVLVEAMHSKQEYQREMESASSSLGLAENRSLTIPDRVEAIPSLIDDFRGYYETIGFALENLKTELEYTQRTLRNAVDVLKTFLEEKQRKISAESGNRINTLVIIFACFGLADALGNFVIFYLQGGEGLTAMLWFTVTMVPLVLILAVVYFGFIKTRR